MAFQNVRNFARLFVSTENRKLNVAAAERVGELCAEQLDGFPQAMPTDGAGQEGIMALLNHRTVKV